MPQTEQMHLCGKIDFLLLFLLLVRADLEAFDSRIKPGGLSK